MKASNLCYGLPEQQAEFVARSAVRVTLEKGEILYREGFEGQLLFLIRTGRVKLSNTTAEGSDVVVWSYGANELVGCLGDSCTYTSAAMAMFPTTALSWRCDELTRNAPGIRQGLMRVMAERIARYERRIVGLYSSDVAERVKWLLLEMAGSADVVEIGLSREEVAAMVGSTLYTVSRILAFWEREGVLIKQNGKNKSVAFYRDRLKDEVFSWEILRGGSSYVAAGVS